MLSHRRQGHIKIAEWLTSKQRQEERGISIKCFHKHLRLHRFRGMYNKYGKWWDILVKAIPYVIMGLMTKYAIWLGWAKLSKMIRSMKTCNDGREEDMHLAEFQTDLGLMQSRQMHFGLMNALGGFCRMACKLLANIEWNAASLQDEASF